MFHSHTKSVLMGLTGRQGQVQYHVCTVVTAGGMLAKQQHAVPFCVIVEVGGDNAAASIMHAVQRAQCRCVAAIIVELSC